MSLTAVKTAIVDAFKLAIPDLRTCETHGGRFDEKELQRISRRPPALFVAALGMGDFEDRAGSNSYEIRFGVFLIAKDQPGQQRAEVCELLAEAVLKTLKGNRWDQDAVESRPSNIAASNLYGANIDRHSVAMWAVTWRQRVDLGTDIDVDQLHDFLELQHTIDLNTDSDGEPLAVDNIEIPQE